MLEENEAESDSSDDLVLEDNAAGRTSDSEGPMLEENEDGGSGGGGAPSAERADALRAEGNGHFKVGRVAEARAAYGAALSSLPPRLLQWAFCVACSSHFEHQPD